MMMTEPGTVYCDMSDVSIRSTFPSWKREVLSDGMVYQLVKDIFDGKVSSKESFELQIKLIPFMVQSNKDDDEEHDKEAAPQDYRKDYGEEEKKVFGSKLNLWAWGKLAQRAA